MSLCIFLPSIFALGILFFPKGKEEWMRWWTLFGTALTLTISMIVFIDYLAMPNSGTLDQRVRVAQDTEAKHDARDSLDMVARYNWIPNFNIEYYLGIDGISMALILLTTLLFFLSMIASWNITKYVKGYCALFLILETGVLGSFFALDFFLFYIFWEVMLLPMYFLIGVWGGPRGNTQPSSSSCIRFWAACSFLSPCWVSISPTCVISCIAARPKRRYGSWWIAASRRRKPKSKRRSIPSI